MNAHARWVGAGAGLVLLLAVTPGVQAQSFLDRLKEAAEKSLQQQQQQQQSRQQQQTRPPPHAAAAPSAPVNTTQIKAFDVRDIALGMSLAEAEAVLRKHYPDFHIIPLNYTGFGQQWTGVLAAMPKAQHKHELVLVDFPQPPLPRKVIAVTRYVEFPANATPSLENVEAGLSGKYGAWTKGEATTRAGHRKLYGWWTNPSANTCINERLTATFGRLKKITDAGGLSRVLGDAYGDPSQYLTHFREYIQLTPEIAACERQVAVELNFRPDQHMSPVNKMVTVVADFATFFEGEVRFSELATDFERRRAAGAVERGGIPDL